MKIDFVKTAALLLASGHLLAAEPQKHPVRDSGLKEKKMNQVFQRLDVDQSGGVSLEEFESAPKLTNASEEQKNKLFQRLDKNQDGALQPRELKLGKDRKHRDWRPKGPLTFEEFITQPRINKLDPEKQQKLFKRLDKNGDNILSKEDRGSRSKDHPPRKRRKGPPSFEQMDLDNDGKISFAEFHEIPHIHNLGEDAAEDRFEALDLDQDGFLSPEENPVRKPRPHQKRKGKNQESAPPLFEKIE